MVAAAGQSNMHLLALAVLARIRQPLLDDAVDGVLQFWRQPVTLDLAAELDTRAAFNGVVINKMRNGRFES